MKKNILKTLAILIGSAIGGYLLLVIAFSIPTGRVNSNVTKSAAAFTDTWPTIVNKKSMTQLDKYTDSLMLLTASNDSDKNLLTRPIHAYHVADDNPEGILYYAISNPDKPDNHQEEYSRYWHGYMIFLKPLLVLFDYNNILILLSFVVIALIAAVIYLMTKKKLNRYVIPYVLTNMLLYPAAISNCIQQSTIFIIANLSIIAILLFYDKIKKSKNFFFLFLIIGIITSFFDLLSYPLVALGFPMLFWLLLANQEKVEKNGANIKQTIIGSLAWGIGYFVFWAEKIAFGSLITGSNLFSGALEAAQARSSTQVLSQEASRLTGIINPAKTLLNKPTIALLALALTILIVLLIIKKIKISKEKAISNLWILFICLMPIVWCLALANHSAIHIFFSFRTLVVFFFALFCYIASIIEIPKKKTKKK